ncbi:unnamed protein product [Rotaria sp. Silwood2]|nr:unnamed protein product [Rotaria sp. Silwood2]CAF3216864.1 unnamed protein product [Rotaria sp. Silwood2]CAF4470755.1 unnamed protein product [Rotaria sp. Silwood2]CAF4582848.1 unnamed protein product [Rotaria sp. Silwood2]
MKDLVDKFTDSTRSEFQRTLSITRTLITANAFISTIRISKQVKSTDGSRIDIMVPILQRGDLCVGYFCSCLLQSVDCYEYANINYPADTFESTAFTAIENKCFMTETVLKASLECWFDDSCFDVVYNYYVTRAVDNLISINPLDIHISSKFMITDTMEILMNALLLENQTVNVSYNQYYNKCSPLFCTYDIQQRFDLIFLITSIAAMYAVLSKFLRLILPMLVHLIFIAWKRFRSQDLSTHQSTSIIQNTHCNST